MNMIKNNRSESLSINILWVSVALFIVLTIAFLLPIHPNDYWWYLRLGREIAEMGKIPIIDTFTYTIAGKPVFYYSWLSACAFWGLQVLGGPTITIFSRGLLIAIFYLFIWLSCKEVGSGPRLASLLTLLAALSGSNNWVVRPQIFAYPLFGLSLWILIRWQKGRYDLMWIMPVVGLIWVNLHGSFLLAFILSGAAILGGEGNRPKLILVFLVMGFFSFINPRGIWIWRDIFITFNNPSTQNFSLEFRPPVNEGWQANLFFAWLLLFIPLAVRSSARMTKTEWVWFLSLGWMALSGLRYIIWFLAILAVLSSKMLSNLLGKYISSTSRPERPSINYALAGFILLLPGLALPGIRERWWSNPPPVLSANTPIDAAHWLSNHPELPGPLWSDFIFSSYLIYALPERPVWIDTRIYPFPPEQWESYLEISDAVPEWEEILIEEGVMLAMIDVHGQRRLLKAMEESQNWCSVYHDNIAAIFYRNQANKYCMAIN